MPALRHIYGPVPSRRLGQSLGIDPIPLKTCNWNCVYCQLGRTRPLTNERRDYYPPQEILAQLARALEQGAPGEVDWVTFVGSGEPTLHASLGWLIRGAKDTTDLPVAVITNGSLLYRPEVRAELAAADAVLPSLDAASEYLYRRINRPHPAITFERLACGLKTFRAEFGGELWPEVMLVDGLNDSEEALHDLAQLLRQVGADEVHLSLPTRPPAETWVAPSDRAGLMRATAILGETTQVLHPVAGTFARREKEDIVDAVVQIITRHPMSQAQLEHTLEEWAPGRTREALRQLEKSDRAQAVERMGTRFWIASPAYFPSEARSRLTRRAAQARRRNNS